MTDTLNQQVRLRDGRLLGFAEYGSAAGAPVFYFHGWPGSRLEPQMVGEPGADLDVRVIATDRPGYGLSEFQAERAMADWPGDVCQLANHLGLERFAVLGVSGGGPYAAACAAMVPGRVSAAAMVCSVSPLDSPEATRDMVPMNRWMLFLARHAPHLARKLGEMSLHIYWHYEREVLPRQILIHLPPADKQLLARPELQRVLLANWRESFRSGPHGMMWDGCLYAQPWGFRLEEIGVPVQVWQGEADVIVPPSMGRHCAELIPNCQARFLPGEGHFSLPINHIGEILGALTERSRKEE